MMMEHRCGIGLMSRELVKSAFSYIGCKKAKSAGEQGNRGGRERGRNDDHSRWCNGKDNTWEMGTTTRDVLGIDAKATFHQTDHGKLPFSYSSGVFEFGRGVRSLLPNLRFGELLNWWDVMFSDLFCVGISAKTLSNTDLKLDNQVSVTESHPVSSNCNYIWYMKSFKSQFQTSSRWYSFTNIDESIRTGSGMTYRRELW